MSVPADLKTRGPAAVWLLSLVTFGIYYLVWLYKTASDIQALSPQHPKNVSPANLVLSFMFGALTLYIWPIINWFKFTGSIRAEQEAVGLPATSSTGLATLLVFVVSTHTIYLQSQQNLVVEAVKARQGVAV